MPDFNIAVKPALTLADTTINVSRYSRIPGPDMNVEEAVRRWITKHRPGLQYDGFGSVSGILPAGFPTSLQVIDNIHSKAIVTLTPTAIGHRVVDNSDSDIAQEASVDFSDSLSTESTIGWEASLSLGASFTVGVEVGGEFAKASASSTYSIEASVGRSSSESRSIEVGVTEGEKVEVPPGEIALLVGLLQRGTLTFDVPVSWRPDNGQTIVRVFYWDAAKRGPMQITPVTVDDLAAAMGYRTDIAHVVLPFASEAQSKVIAPLASDTAQAVQEGLREALSQLGAARC